MSSDQAYLLVKLELESVGGPGSKLSKGLDLSEDYLLHNVTHGLTKLFGQAGSAAPVEIHQVIKSTTGKSKASTDLVLACPTHFVTNLRSSLTLQGSYQGHPCAYTVFEVATDPSKLPNPKSLSGEQRYF